MISNYEDLYQNNPSFNHTIKMRTLSQFEIKVQTFKLKP